MIRRKRKKGLRTAFGILVLILLCTAGILYFKNIGGTVPANKNGTANLTGTTSMVQSSAQQKIVEQDIGEKIDEYMNAHTKMGYFSGSVLAAKGGKVLLSKGYGMANIELNVPNNEDTKFRLGSVTKQFTAMCIMMLQEKGLLNVADPISKFIPDYPKGNKITIHQLLVHTSGITDYINDDKTFSEEGKIPMSSTQILDRFKNKPLLFTPGSKTRYSNTDYFLLGYIIEKVSKKSYETFINENIFTPLGMKDTGCDRDGLLLKNRASGYGFSNGKLVGADYTEISNFFANGNLYSTVKDLYIWDRALYTEKLVSKNSIDAIFKDYGGNYGYGWRIEKSGYAYHTGRVNGFYAYIGRSVKDDSSVIVLSNNWNVQLKTIYTDIENILFERKYTMPSYKSSVVTELK